MAVSHVVDTAIAMAIILTWRKLIGDQKNHYDSMRENQNLGSPFKVIDYEKD